ncbi:type I polyketide synthase [Kitasatospora sp. NPDC050463]|uniref:type I polyketide synthase n=1 Tax=Kitasatospora sp. NPDC050463 TaxID=3155786 RepID=UPI0033E562EA
MTQRELGGGPIAIVGMAARFPGAADVDRFWDAIQAGREAIRDVGDEELLRAGVAPEWLKNPDYVKATASIEDVDLFDAAFFDISGREAAVMDPQHRIFLETCWHALENAGLRSSARDGASVGVFAGSGGILTSYLPEVLDNSGLLEDPTASLEQLGSDKDFLATRVSYKLNLTGPSLTVQTACSTSLVAVHLACQSLLRGECDAALAGGVNVRLPDPSGHWYRRGGILSPDGRCRPFDVSAQGTIFGSGVGAVVLKPLDAALRDGDTVYATILGTAINNDGGGKSSYGAASQPGQLAAMRRALAVSGVDPATIGYIEAHGTGVPLGDPTEIGALKKIFGGHAPVAIGSVKALIGHMEAASGIAGLIKTALALHRGQIPPSPYFTAPSPRLNLDGSGLFVNAEPLPMPGSPRRAAVNSLGIGGTNAFAVLEQAPDRAPVDRRPGPELVRISAKSADALRTLAGQWADRLREPGAVLADLAHTSHVGRRAQRHRLSVLADSEHAAAERIESWLRDGTGQADAGEAARSRPRVGFLFPGQSSEYVGMGVELYREHPVFRAAVDRHAELFRRLTGVGPLDVFADPAAQARAELLQPAVFLLQVALAEFWASCGVRPDAVVGHSLGEYAAACVAGVFSPEEGLELVCARGRAFGAVPGSGRMVAVGCTDVAGLERLVEARGGSAAIAAYNAPQRFTVSGSDAEMSELESAFRQRGWETIALETTHAFHSSLVAPAVPALVEAAGRITHRPPTVPMALNLTGTWAVGGDLGAQYWGRQLTSPVRFAPGIRGLLDGGCTVFLEVGSGRTLTTSGRAQSTGDAVWLAGLAPRIPDPATVLAHLARLERAGVAVDWARYNEPFGARRVPAPLYPFARTRHWIAPAQAPAVTAPPAGPAGEPPALSRLALPQSAQRRYETTVAAQAPRVLADHEIAGRLVVPGAYHTACLVEAVDSASATVVEDLVFPRALEVAETERRIQLVLTPAGDGRFVAQSLGLARVDDPLADESWQVHAEGRIQQVGGAAEPPRRWTDPSGYRAGRPVAAAELYPLFEANGFGFGPTFQWIKELRLVGEDSTGDLCFAAASPRERTMALLDSCVQLAIAARIVRKAPEDGVLLPFRIERAVFHAAGNAAESGVALIRHRAAEASRAVADVSLTDHEGNPLLELFGLELRAVSFRSPSHGEPAGPGTEAPVYAEEWEPIRPTGGASPTTGPWIVLADRQGHWRHAVTALEAAGSRCVIAEVGETFARHDDHHYALDPADAESLERLLRDTGPASILHCLGLDGLGPAGPETRTACGSLPALAQAAERAGWAPTSVVLLTRGAVDVHGSAETGDPYGSMLWGLGRSAALEAPQLGVRLLDMDPRDLPGALRTLPGLLAPADAPAEAAIRDGRVHRPVLRRASMPTARPGRLGADGCYLITGGTGALGLRTAAWLARHGVRHVVLASRRAPEARIAEQVGELERSGLKVTLVGLDVTDEAAVKRLVERAGQEWGGLKGVVHAAGVLDDAVLPQLSWERFQAVLDPKVAGGWHLHRATLGLDLEQFILFSSTAALLGAPGQAHYAAGNAFLDGLAHYRRGLGLPALSVNWGPWESGMVARLSPRLQARILDGGFTPLENGPAFAALDRLLAGPGGQYGVFSVDWSRYLARFPGGRAVALDEEPAAPAQDGAEAVRRLRRDGPGATPERRRELVFEYLRVMLATRLGMSEAAVHEDLSLHDAGLDSLVAVEVRGQIFRDLDIDLPLIGLLEGKALRPLVDELAERLARDLPAEAAPAAEESPAAADAAPFSPQEAERLLASLDSLTEDQIQALLPWLADQDAAEPTEG